MTLRPSRDLLCWALVALGLTACASAAQPHPGPPPPERQAAALVASAAVGAEAVAAERFDALEAEREAKLSSEAQQAARALVAAADRAALDVDGVDCLQWLAARDVSFEIVTDHVAERPRRARDTCTIEEPVRLGAQVGSVRFSHDDMLMSCALARSMVRLSALLEERGITEVDIATPFACNTLPHRRRVSQHGHGNALDVSALRTASGREYAIEDWERRDDTPETEAGQLWYDLVHQLYDEGIFHILLTPDYDRHHRHWLHLDLTPGERFLR